MFVSAYLMPLGLWRLTWRRIRAFALKTLDRILKEVWSETRAFATASAAPLSKARFDDQVFSVLALLDAYEPRSITAIFSTHKKP